MGDLSTLLISLKFTYYNVLIIIIIISTDWPNTAPFGFAKGH